LTLNSTALQELASFIGRQCGSGWREEGLAEKVLEEIARSWKNSNGGVIVEGSSKALQDILKTLEGNMSGGKIVGQGRGLSRENSLLGSASVEGDIVNTRLGLRPQGPVREDSNTSFGMSSLGVSQEADEDDEVNDPRGWLKVIDAYEQPRLLFNVGKKHFERYDTSTADSTFAILNKLTKQQRRHEAIVTTSCLSQNNSVPQSLSCYSPAPP
jgi:DNA polymerase epsilon subunit 2